MSTSSEKSITPLACAIVFMAQMATTIYLPSLPDVAIDLGVSESVTKLSVTLFVIAAALPVVAWGRVADRYGRRTALLSSLGIFLIACVALAFASNAAVLLGGRIVQGVGAGGAAIVVRMIVKDRFAGDELAAKLSLLSMAFVVALGGGQLVGGVIASFGSWRIGFVVLAVVAALAFVVSSRTDNHKVLIKGEQAVSWQTIVLNSKFYKPAIAGGLGFGAIVLVQQLSPFLFAGRFGLQPWAFGAFGILYGGAYFAGAVYVNRYAKKIGSRPVMKQGIVIMVAAGVLLAAIWYPPIGGHTLLVLFVFGYIALTFGQSLLFPNSAATAVTHFAQGGAIAVAYCGLVQQGLAGVASVIGPLASDERVWTAVIAGVTVLAAALVFTLRDVTTSTTAGAGADARH